MTDYKAIVGKGIKVVSTNLDNAEAEGQIWFNSTTGEFKDVLNLEAWSTSGSIATKRFNMGSGVTPVTAGVVFGGTGNSTSTEEYNGTGFLNGGNLGTGRYAVGGFGTQTATVGAGGYVNGTGDVANVEEYNGTAWSEVNDIPAARRGQAGFGTQTAGAIAGGVPNLNTTLHYDGTNWTSGGTLPAGQDRTEGAGTGTLTAGFMAAGDNRTSFEYDGSSWTAGPSTSSDHDGGNDTGIQTAAITFGGFLSPGSGQVTSTELYNGTSFTTSPATLSQGRYGMGNGGFTGTSAFATGGDKNPGTVTDTEEYNSSTTAITGATWSSGGNMNTARGGTNGTSGDKSAGATFGGQTPGGRSNATELYDGSSWTNGTNTPAARRTYLVTGTQTASLLCGGQPPTPTANGDAETYEFDGSSFSETSDINNQRDNAAGAGTQTAALAIGGRTRPGSTFVPNNNVEEYNGSSWSNANTLPAANSSSTSATGPQTAAIFAMASPAFVASYDGTNWTAISATQSMPSSYTGTGVAGTNSSDAYMGGGEEPGGTRHGFVQKYDGTSWASTASFATTRNSFGYNGSSPSQLVCGGQAGPAGGFTNNTEEFTEESSALNIKTVDTTNI